jgi:hypothetical protein
VLILGGLGSGLVVVSVGDFLVGAWIAALIRIGLSLSLLTLFASRANRELASRADGGSAPTPSGCARSRDFRRWAPPFRSRPA